MHGHVAARGCIRGMDHCAAIDTATTWLAAFEWDSDVMARGCGVN
jgi:hypothetical protein